jgi:dihydropyrimidinase
MSLLIEGGRIVTAGDDYVADVYIEDETISLIGTSLDVAADRVIDASGKYVMPGCIDPHTHLDMPFGGTITADDFLSGQVSAAFGGTTCHIDFANQVRGQSFAAGLELWHEKAHDKAVIDYGFHMIVIDIEEGGSLEELATLPDQGVTSYKMLMAYKDVLMVDDETMFRVMELATRTGALVMVHGENGSAIDILVKRAVAEGNLEPRWHALTRPAELEGEATNRAIQLAHVAGCPLYVVHVTCKESVEPIKAARDKGWPVWGETCTQYFFIDNTYLDRPNFEGAKAVFSPPVRDKSNQEVLWNAVKTDALSAISTDHCSFLFDGQKTLGKDDFSKIPNGAPGIETRMSLVYDGGVREGRFSLNRFVDVTSTSPAKIFGLFPRKGTVAAGSDADLVVFDPHARAVLSARTHHMRVDYNPYEGREVVGVTDTVLSRGHVIVDHGRFVGRAGCGTFLPRKARGAA